MEKRDQDAPDLEAPDYFSVVIQWEAEPEDMLAALDLGEPFEALEDEMTDRQQFEQWDEVDEASLESFPASDAPAWGASHAAASESTASLIESQVQAIEPSHWRDRLRRIGVGVALAAIGSLFVLLRRRQRRLA